MVLGQRRRTGRARRGKMLHFQDPEGNRHEVYAAAAASPGAFTSEIVASGFVTGAGGAGHVVFEANNYPAHGRSSPNRCWACT